MPHPIRLFALVLALSSLAPSGSARQSSVCPPDVLLDTSPEDIEKFGEQVAFDGTTLVSAAPYSDRGNGRAQVWRRQNGGWLLEAELTNTVPTANNQNLGACVALDGDRLALSLFRASPTPRVKVYDRTVDPVTGAGTWNETADLVLPPSVASGNPFGSLSLSGDLLVVGSPLSDIGAIPDAGLVFFSKYSGSSWGAFRFLLSPELQAHGHYGWGTALAGKRLAVGAPGENPLLGRVHLYTLDLPTALYVIEDTLLPPATVNVGTFGEHLQWERSGLNDKLYVSSHAESTGLQSFAGAIYEFTEVPQPFPLAPLWVESERITALVPAAQEAFGRDFEVFVPFFGTPRMAVGVPGRGEGAVAVLEPDAGGLWREVHSLPAPSSGVNFGSPVFGEAVAVSGTLVVAGAPSYDANGIRDTGAVLVFDTFGGNCPEVCRAPRLSAPLPSGGEAAGAAVAIAGDWAFVGAPLDDSRGAATGTVRVYRRSVDCWFQVDTLQASDATFDDHFGATLAVDEGGDFLLVGAPFRDTAGRVDSGGAYLFQRVGLGWVEMHRLDPIGPRASGRFGSSLALADRYELMIGEPGTASMHGEVDVFSFDLFAQAYLPVAQLASPTSTSADAFGSSLGYHRDLLVVGDPLDDTLAVDHGAVHVFRKLPFSNLWRNDDTDFGDTKAAEEHFGQALAWRDGWLVVGAPRASVGALPEAGRARLYTLSDFTGTAFFVGWASTSAPSPAASAHFGAAVASDASMAILGATEDGAGGTGRASVAALSVGGFNFQGELAGPGVTPAGGFGSAVALDADWALAGAPSDDAGAADTGSGWAFEIDDLKPLTADVQALSQAAGGTQHLRLDLGPAFANQLYWLMGSATGTSPGFSLGGVQVPLNPDAYWNYTIGQYNGAVLVNTLAFLDAEGRGSAAFVLPPAAMLIGASYHHAALTIRLGPLSFTGATNAVEVRFLP